MNKQWRTVRVLVEIPVRDITDNDIVRAVRSCLERRFEAELYWCNLNSNQIGKPRVKSLKLWLRHKMPTLHFDT